MPDQSRARRARLSVIALGLFLPAIVQGQARTDAPTPRPTAPHVVANACPFECCDYGRWRLRTAALVRAKPVRAAPATATLPRGTPVTADSGIVIVTRLGIVAVRAPYRDQEMGDDYAAGDTIVILDYLGEGVHNAWYRGRMRQVMEYWGRRDTLPAQLVVRPESQWWAHVRWKSRAQARQGWIDMEHVGVAGADRCG